MFVRITKFKECGKEYEYLRIVESYREGGKKKQKVIANLGAVKNLNGKLDAIVDVLRKYCKVKYVKSGEIKIEQAPTWGTILVARKLWNEIGLGEIIRNRCKKLKKGKQIEELAFVLVASSLVRPSSEHGLGWWLEESYVCNSKGERYLPDWKEVVTKEKRVRIKWGQLKLWYKVLDKLMGAKEEIEEEIYLKLRDLFGLKVDIVFYDITSIYFEGEGPDELAGYGKSKDGKDRNRQILLGVVMASGWPVAHHVFSGNTSEKLTIEEVIRDLKNRFQIERIIFVGDCGIVSSENLEKIEGEEYKYIVAMSRRKNKGSEEMLEKSKWKWQECGNRSKVEEIKIEGKEGIRYFIVSSEERKEYEVAIRKNNMARTKGNLEKLRIEIEKGEVKKPEEIGYKVSSILKEVKGYRYYSWEVTKDKKFKYWEDKEKMRKEKQIEGKYLLKTNDKTIGAKEVVKAYKELSNVESAFREFKDVLEGRPIWHQTSWRVRAHIFVRSLGYLLDTVLRKAMEKAEMNLTVEEAIRSLEQVKITELRLAGEKYQIVTGAKKYAASVLNSVGLGGYKRMLPGSVV